MFFILSIVGMNEDMIVKIVIKMIDNMPIVIFFLFNPRPAGAPGFPRPAGGRCLNTPPF